MKEPRSRPAGRHRSRRRGAWWVVSWTAIGLLAGCRGAPEEPEPIVVFAAASLTDVLEVLADSFEVAHPAYRLELNVAGTSLLARQIEQGAPADLFFSASIDWMRYLRRHGRVAGPVYRPLGNRLVVAGRAGAPPLTRFSELARTDRLAVADPGHVPAGVYAKAGLRCAGLWDDVAPRVIPTLDVRAALLAVRGGAAERAVVYASDARVDPGVRVLAAWPEACQPAIRYAVARLHDAPHPEAAARLLRFLVDARHAAVWERFGFVFHSPAMRPAAP